MNIQKDLSDRIFVGQSRLQSGDDEPQIIDNYQLEVEFPEDSRTFEVCLNHIEQGEATELMGDFVLGGVRFPERNEPQEITTQLSCKGTSCILKKCGLKVEQFDAAGDKIGEMRRM